MAEKLNEEHLHNIASTIPSDWIWALAIPLSLFILKAITDVVMHKGQNHNNRLIFENNEILKEVRKSVHYTNATTKELKLLLDSMQRELSVLGGIIVELNNMHKDSDSKFSTVRVIEQLTDLEGNLRSDLTDVKVALAHLKPRK